MQSAGVAYTFRSHAAEETFFTIGGHAGWVQGDGPETRIGSGHLVFHASGTKHATMTYNAPIIALWRWSGDISWDSYRMA